MEQWKIIEDYPSYKISDQGRLYNIITKRFLTGSVMSGGYIRVGISNEIGKKNFLLHRIVAKHFIPNPENKPEVNHLGEKNDNRVCMLEWATRKENCIHSAKFKTKNFVIPVNRIDAKTNEILQTYSSITEAVKDGYISNSISLCVNGRMNQHRGFKWRSVEPIKKEVDYEDEIWKELKDSEYNEVNIFPKYKVSNYGRIKGWYNNILKLNNCNGYETIKLNNENKTYKVMRIHRLVLMAFNISNPENKKEVDHIDSNILNNKLENLRWADRKDQVSNPETNKKLKKKNKKICLKIRVIYKGKISIVYGLNYLSRKIDISPITIKKYAKLGEEYRGYLFEILDENYFTDENVTFSSVK